MYIICNSDWDSSNWTSIHFSQASLYKSTADINVLTSECVSIAMGSVEQMHNIVIGGHRQIISVRWVFQTRPSTTEAGWHAIFAVEALS